MSGRLCGLCRKPGHTRNNCKGLGITNSVENELVRILQDPHVKEMVLNDNSDGQAPLQGEPLGSSEDSEDTSNGSNVQSDESLLESDQSLKNVDKDVGFAIINVDKDVQPGFDVTNIDKDVEPGFAIPDVGHVLPVPNVNDELAIEEKPMKEWTIQEVKTWASKLFDVNIGERFFTEGISGKALEMIEENHLKDMGIGLGTRLEILNGFFPFLFFLFFSLTHLFFLTDLKRVKQLQTEKKLPIENKSKKVKVENEIPNPGSFFF